MDCTILSEHFASIARLNASFGAARARSAWMEARARKRSAEPPRMPRLRAGTSRSWLRKEELHAGCGSVTAEFAPTQHPHLTIREQECGCARARRVQREFMQRVTDASVKREHVRFLGLRIFTHCQQLVAAQSKQARVSEGKVGLRNLDLGASLGTVQIHDAETRDLVRVGRIASASQIRSVFVEGDQ